ncbi:hypothetical protein CRG98_026145 [Punica granatum]|uniref:FAS1 domain-containing protein n=1 Tax=Punica granatum TaxID=22663 RepID=A0A2I0JB36_PUNGR|nr:hypothetical protein CRG98_026145 [Punica granatum]
MAIVPAPLLTFTALSLLYSAAQTAVTGEFFLSTPLPYQHLSSAWLLEPILANLGFHELSMAVNGLSDFPAVAHWDGPTTLFAPSDAAVESCFSCSVPRILAEHMVPGLFSSSELRDLAAHGTRIETMNPGHCITLSSDSAAVINNQGRVFVDAAEITHPDMFNNGLMIVHGLGDHLVSLLHPLSCSSTARSRSPPPFLEPPVTAAASNPRLVMSLMLRDAMVRLNTGGFAVLALALRERFEDLVALQNATLFAMEDRSVFSDPRNYAGNVWFHIVPNRFLAIGDLASLPVGSTLETMERGRNLVVTSSGELSSALQINGVRVKIPEVVKNARLVVHSIFLPFVQLRSGPSIDNVIDGGGEVDVNRTAPGSPPTPRQSIEDQEGCGLGPTAVEDSHGL